MLAHKHRKNPSKFSFQYLSPPISLSLSLSLVPHTLKLQRSNFPHDFLSLLVSFSKLTRFWLKIYGKLKKKKNHNYYYYYYLYFIFRENEIRSDRSTNEKAPRKLGKKSSYTKNTNGSKGKNPIFFFLVSLSSISLPLRPFSDSLFIVPWERKWLLTQKPNLVVWFKSLIKLRK